MRNLYIVTYDISDRVRWAKVYKAMRGFGEHLQLSVFQCDLTPAQKIRMKAALGEIIHHEQEIEAIGRPMEVLGREPMVV
jgi:CRISPR-associated protein Cas2